jgi:purine nucleosidase
VTDPVPILLDTDLGTDVDDAIALAFLVRDPRCDLRGVTTVNGDTRRRAALTKALLDLMKADDVPVGVGASLPIDGVKASAMPVGIVAREPLADLPDDLPAAEDVLVDVLRAATTPVHVVGIGAFTNVASLLVAHPGLHEAVAGVHLMGGCLGSYRLVPGGEQLPAKPEFNLNGDPTAAAVCLGLPLRLRLAPYEVTNELMFTEADRAAIAAAGELGAALELQMNGWLDLLQRSPDPDVPHVRLHDPLTVVGIVDPAVETTETLQLSVRGKAGDAFLVESPEGRPVEVVRSADGDALRRQLVAAITG